MNIDFTNQIKELKEKDVLHKPFPVAGGGYALFAKNQEGNFVKILFSNQDHIKKYLNDLGYNWGNEGKNEYTNFDSLNRLLTVMPELSGVETVAADPQWEISEKAVDFPENSSKRNMEDMPDAVKLREVDHPLHWDESNYDVKSSDCKCENCSCDPCECEENLAKKPDFLKKKGDKKDDKKNGKKDDKKNGEKGDKEEKDKNGKKLPPWLKKKSKSNYSKLWKKVNANIRKPGQMFGIGDTVENINPDCEHFGSRGNVVGMRKLTATRRSLTSASKHKEEEDELGYVFAYSAINAGANWEEGDVLEKTGDQLQMIEGLHNQDAVRY